jgi:hypothetical protein
MIPAQAFRDDPLFLFTGAGTLYTVRPAVSSGTDGRASGTEQRTRMNTGRKPVCGVGVPKSRTGSTRRCGFTLIELRMLNVPSGTSWVQASWLADNTTVKK